MCEIVREHLSDSDRDYALSPFVRPARIKASLKRARGEIMATRRAVRAKQPRNFTDCLPVPNCRVVGLGEEATYLPLSQLVGLNVNCQREQETTGPQSH